MTAYSLVLALATGGLLVANGFVSAHAASPVQSPDGRISFPAEAALLQGPGLQRVSLAGSSSALVVPASGAVSATWEFKPTRWGRYDLEMTYAAATAPGDVQIRVAGQTFDVAPGPTGGKDRFSPRTVARLYLPKSEPFTVDLRPTGSGGHSEFQLQSLALVPAPEGGPITASPEGGITLHSREATTHSAS